MAIPNFYNALTYPNLRQVTPAETFYSAIKPYEEMKAEQQKNAMDQAELGLKTQDTANRTGALAIDQSRLGIDQAKFDKERKQDAVYMAIRDEGLPPAEMLVKMRTAAFGFGDQEGVKVAGEGLAELSNRYKANNLWDKAAEIDAIATGTPMGPEAGIYQKAAAFPPKTNQFGDVTQWVPGEDIKVTPSLYTLEKRKAAEARGLRDENLYSARLSNLKLAEQLKTKALNAPDKPPKAPTESKETGRKLTQLFELENQLSHLKGKRFSKWNNGRIGEANPDYNDQVTANNEMIADTERRIAMLKGEPVPKSNKNFNQLMSMLQSIRNGGKEGIKE